MARLNLLSVLLYGKSSWILLIRYTEIGEHKNTFLALEAKSIL